MQKKRPHRPRAGRALTVSEVAGLLYCERKAYYDRAYGKKTTSQAGKRAKEGEIAHLRFAEEGAKRQDKRCFIASAVYGPDAIQTRRLRHWRDQTLMCNAPGRLVVQAYYLVSPPIAEILARSPHLSAAMRRMLDTLVARIG